MDNKDLQMAIDSIALIFHDYLKTKDEAYLTRIKTILERTSVFK